MRNLIKAQGFLIRFLHENPSSFTLVFNINTLQNPEPQTLDPGALTPRPFVRQCSSHPFGLGYGV